MPVHIRGVALTSAALSALMVHAISHGIAFTAALVITLACGALVVGTFLRYWITRRWVSGDLHTHMAAITCVLCNRRPCQCPLTAHDPETRS
jgi:site-specific recombinase